MNTYKVSHAVQNAKNLPGLVSELRQLGVDSAYHDWAMRLFLDAKAREKAVPIKGIFELTPYCNLDCKMCYVHLNSEQMKGCSLLSADEWESIMAQAVESGMIFATLTGGECLTYPDFERLYLFLNSHSVRVVVLTNGVLLDEEKITFFKKYPPFFLQITLYGANEEMYEKVTGKREFSMVLSNIRNAANAGLPVKITVTPNPYLTVEENKELIRFAASLGVNFQINSGLFAPRSETARDADFRDLKAEDYVEFFRLEKSLKGELPPPECTSGLPETGGEESEAPKGLRCGGARSSFNVTWKGNLVPCNRLTHISSNPLEKGFASSWDEIHAAAMEILLPAECENCAYKHAAKGCVAGHSDAKPGHASPEQCKWCHAMVKGGLSKLSDE